MALQGHGQQLRDDDGVTEEIDAFCLYVNTVEATNEYAKHSKPAVILPFRKYPPLAKKKHSGKSQNLYC